MKLVESPVWLLDQILNDLMGDFVVASSDCFIDVALKIYFDLRSKLVYLLEGLVVNSFRVQNISYKALVSGEINWISIVIVFILEEGIVTLTITSCHLNFSHSCAISHMADHT